MDDEGLARLVFADIDLDGSGTLDKLEVDTAARRLGVALTQREIDEGFAAMDADGTYKCTATAAPSTLAVGTVPRVLGSGARAHSMLAGAGNGAIEFSEFFEWFQSMQQRHISERGGWCQVAQLRAAYYKERIKGNTGKARELLSEMGESAFLCSPV